MTDVDSFSIDNASFATTVPEPSTVLAFAVLAGGSLLSRRKRS